MTKPSIYSPEFIPFYCGVAKRYKLNHLEGLVYGFVRFYTSSSEKHFYFSNKQMGKILDKSVSSIQRAVGSLVESGLLNAEYEVKAKGGTIRFLRVETRPGKNAVSDQSKTPGLTSQKRCPKYNKVKENKIKIPVEAKASGLRSIKNVLQKKKILPQPKRGASHEWQDTAVRWWKKLNLRQKPTASWFKLFKTNSGIAERACSWASDSGGDDLEKLVYWAYHQFRKNGKIVFDKNFATVANGVD